MLEGPAAGFLERLADSYSILADLRNCPGVTPDEALEVVGELALIGEAGLRGHLRQGQTRSDFQELLGPLDATSDDVLVGRQPSGLLELTREVVDAKAAQCRHLFQARVGVE